jgi:hypothetical protein
MKYILILLFLFSSSVYAQNTVCNSRNWEGPDCKNKRLGGFRDKAKRFQLERKEQKETMFREECYKNEIFIDEDDWCVKYKKIKDDKARILKEQEIEEIAEEDLIEDDTQDLQSNIEEAKSICNDIGFKAGTEKFGECVLKLYSKDKVSNKTRSIEREQEEADRKYKLEQQRQLDIANQRLELEKRRIAIEEERANRDKWNSISKGLKDLSNTLYPNTNQQNNNTNTNRRMNCTNNHSNLPNAVPSVTCREY